MNSQLDLIFRDPSARKHKGSPTSMDAHARVIPTKAAAWRRIMDLMQARGDYGLTSKEAAAAFGVQLNTISGRFSELRAMGWIKENGERRDNAAVLVVK